MRSARLASGWMSRDQHFHLPTYSPYSEWKEIGIQGEENPHQASEPPLGQAGCQIQGLTINELKPAPHPDKTWVVERPAWQALVLAVQLHYPYLALEIEPAHNIGLLSAPRVALSYEATTMLNYFIERWYGAEVEVITTQMLTDPADVQGFPEVASYSQPYRPVTGLQVIVTGTKQWARDQYSREVMRERERWGRMGGVDALKAAWKMYVCERVPHNLPKRRPTSRTRSWIHFFARS